ncbi:helix-turn-helix domain-containing protein [Streptomyces sp. NPDC048584]|uniref:helix-turn-helix domain-containing protein n=1 Tax=Streptomyces sp. NPDC048584 TaxID=3365573 RepID=UPI00371E2B1E
MTQKPTGLVRSRRLARGLTLEELAAQCADAGVPVHNSQLSRIERGVASCRPRLRVTLARLLDIDAAEVAPMYRRGGEGKGAA